MLLLPAVVTVVAAALRRYRCVVVGRDRLPAVDVRGWDGLEGLPDAHLQPFYRVVCDAADEAEAFGADRVMGLR